jgi:predicted MFS family arabinose efflux permease
VRPTASTDGVRRRLFGGAADVIGRPWARVVLATVLIEGMVFFGAYAFVPFYLHERFAISLTHAGLVAATLGLGGLAFSFSVRVLVQRLGETGLAIGGGSVLAAGLALIALAPSPGWAIPGCFACGVGFYMLHNTLQLNATQMAPEHRGTAVSLFASMLFLGQAVGVSVAGLLVPALGVRALLGGGAVALLLVGVSFYLRLRTKHAAAA